jgi:hypothetical protein
MDPCHFRVLGKSDKTFLSDSGARLAVLLIHIEDSERVRLEPLYVSKSSYFQVFICCTGLIEAFDSHHFIKVDIYNGIPM